MSNEKLKNLASAKRLGGKADKCCHDTGPCSARSASNFRGIMPFLRKRAISENRPPHSLKES